MKVVENSTEYEMNPFQNHPVAYNSIPFVLLLQIFNYAHTRHVLADYNERNFDDQSSTEFF